MKQYLGWVEIEFMGKLEVGSMSDLIVKVSELCAYEKRTDDVEMSKQVKDIQIT